MQAIWVFTLAFAMKSGPPPVQVVLLRIAELDPNLGILLEVQRPVFAFRQQSQALLSPLGVHLLLSRVAFLIHTVGYQRLPAHNITYIHGHGHQHRYH